MTRPACNTGTGFYVGSDGKLYDPSNREFRIRGVNRNHYDNSAAAGITKSRAVAERFLLYWDNGTTAAQFVTQLYNECYSNGIVAIPGVWTTATAYGHATVTCSNDTADLQHAVDEWVGQAADWTANYQGIPTERWMIINIANEWGPANSTTWRDANVDAIAALRTAGYKHTLLVDAGSCGQDFDDLTKYAAAVFASDPQRNVVFAIHVYGNIQAGQASAKLAPLAALGVPVIIGEFGPGRNIGPSPTDLTPGELITAAEALNLGWLAWAWDDNDLPGSSSDDGWFAMVYNNNVYAVPADLTIFGTDVVLNSTYGLQVANYPMANFTYVPSSGLVETDTHDGEKIWHQKTYHERSRQRSTLDILPAEAIAELMAIDELQKADSVYAPLELRGDFYELMNDDEEDVEMLLLGTP